MYKRGPFYWIKRNEEYLLTNDLGRFIYLSENQFSAFLAGTLNESDPTLSALQDRGFLYFDDAQEYVQRWAGELAVMKECVFSATQLFILVLTNACNQRCTYCQAGVDGIHAAMDVQTCKKAIDMAVQSPVNRVTIEFQGGEPTLNAPVLRFAIPYAREVFAQHGKRVDFALVTNLTNVDEKMLRWLVYEEVHISTSLDGPEMLHNSNRPLTTGKGSYAPWQQGVAQYQKILAECKKPIHVSAIQTTTRNSLAQPKEIVEEYLRNNMNHLYIRPLTPLGCAADRWKEIGYTAEEYLHFYCALLDYTMEKCLSGTYVCEATASIYLTRILCNESVGHTEHRSPCGGAIGQMAVNFDGKVYTCDEARMLANMGDDLFLLGTVDDSYNDLISAPTAHAVCTASCVETLPYCQNCVYVPYCSVCPVVTYGLEQDLISHNAQNYRCTIAKGILDYLFTIIYRGNPEEMRVLQRWAEEG